LRRLLSYYEILVVSEARFLPVRSTQHNKVEGGREQEGDRYVPFLNALGALKLVPRVGSTYHLYSIGIVSGRVGKMS